MNIIFLGYMVPLEQMDQYSGISVAGNKMQYNIVNELNKLPNVTVHSVSMEPYACFPTDKRIFIRGRRYEYNGVECNHISYCNFPLVKQITQIISIYRQAKPIIKKLKKRNEDIIIMGFNMFPQIGIPLKWLKKYEETVCVLADLPIDDNTHRKGFSKLLRKMFDLNTTKNLSSCDNYIVLSNYVKQELLSDKNVIIVEGGINDDDIGNSGDVGEKNHKTIILFSGALTEYNGIINLIEAMKYLKTQDVELRIFGGGYLKEYVVESQKKDNRIKYCGQVSNEEMMYYQREADILINPRQVDNPISKYTFPSKTFEYFLSKTIVVSTIIPSYTEEYLDKMVLAEDSAQGLSEAIQKVLVMSIEEKRKIVDRAYDFVCNEKRWGVQISKMYSFIQSILKAI